MSSPRVLIVAQLNWAIGGKLAIALANRGFLVAAAAPPNHVARKVKCIARHFRLSSAGSVRRAIAAWEPDILIPCDDPVVQMLHRLAGDQRETDGARRLRGLLERSLGDSKNFAITGRRSSFASEAPADASPKTEVVSSPRDLVGVLRGLGYPAVLKADETWGGSGVKIVASEAEAIRAFQELTRPPDWLRVTKRTAVKRNLESVRKRLSPSSRVVVQQFIEGVAANRAALCWNGEVLAGVSAIAVHTMSPTGAATIVRLTEHPQMTETVRRVVRKLSISGFYGFDFMLDRDNRAWLIEMNPRATPTTHLVSGFARSDLIGALYRALTGEEAPLGMICPETVTLFPKAILHDPLNPSIALSYHDVPWHETEFVKACLKQRVDRIDRALRFLGGLWRSGGVAQHGKAGA